MNSRTKHTIYPLPTHLLRRDRGQGFQRSPLFALAILVLVGVCTPSLARANPPEAEATAIEAAMLRNFARYVTWPKTAFHDEKAPWRICVLGSDPFGPILERTVLGRIEQGRSFAITRASEPSELTSCQIVFVGGLEEQLRRRALATWKGLPILTVSGDPGFLQEGGTIRFDIADRVEISVNLDQSRSLGLTIQTKLLEVAREVLDNGSIRRRH